MKQTTVTLTDEQRKFLARVAGELDLDTLTEAVKWCIDSCMRIEHNYNDTEDGPLDACYVAHHDIRFEGHPAFAELEIDPEYPIKTLS